MKINHFNYLLDQNDYIKNHFKNNPLKNLKKILIIGSNGLVGLNILSSLINLKKKFNLQISVYCVSKSSIFKKFNEKDIKFLKLDITKNKLKQKFDLIFFCAGYSSPSSFIKDKNTLFVSSYGLNNAFHSLKKKGKLVFFSSSEIYNGLEKNYFILKALKNNKIRMIDRGQSLRKYIFIGDVMIYMFKLLEKNKVGTYNISGESKTTILNLAKIISQLTNTDLFYPKRNKSMPGAPKVVNISFEKIKKVYNFRLVSLSEGLKRTIKWYKLLLKN